MALCQKGYARESLLRAILHKETYTLAETVRTVNAFIRKGVIDMATGGGGTWTGQNKIRPGVYIRFRSTGSTGLTAGDRGTVTICEPMSWGPWAR